MLKKLLFGKIKDMKKKYIIFLISVIHCLFKSIMHAQGDVNYIGELWVSKEISTSDTIYTTMSFIYSEPVNKFTPYK